MAADTAGAARIRSTRICPPFGEIRGFVRQLCPVAHIALTAMSSAIVLRGQRGKLIETSIEMTDIAFELLLETNASFQPLPVWEEEWDHPETHSNPRLVENIRREGLPL
jgi:hypothetical protein